MVTPHRPAASEIPDPLPRAFDVYIGAAAGAQAVSGKAPHTPRYSLEEKIAEGGMGVIIKVFDHSLQRTLAMKLAREPAAAGGSAEGSNPSRSRFLKEAQVTGQLEHPGIVPVHELGTCDGDRAYFTMPLVRGKDLGEVFLLARAGKEGWNLLPRALAALIRVCQAVAFAHSKGVVHRDLKPQNVMVGRFGEVYVLDWGLAKTRNESPELRPDSAGTPPAAPSSSSLGGTDRIAPSSSIETMDGTVMGTPAYMSPEQAAGRLGEVDEASDVYSLGAMLYELLAGQPPYMPAAAKISPKMVLARVLEEPPRPVAAISPSAPRELVAICDRAMARDKAARYRGSFEMAEDLQAYLDHRVVSAYQTGPVARLRAWMVRHRSALSAVAAAVIIVGFVLAGAGWTTRDREARRLLESADERLAAYHRLKSELPRLEDAWRRAVPEEQWWPVWRRGRELEAHQAIEQAPRDLAVSFDGAVRDFEAAGNAAPVFSVRHDAREKLRSVYAQRRREILAGARIVESSEFYARKLRDLGGRLEDQSAMRIESAPPGADVYCFRYEEREAHLAPLPFDPARGKVVGPSFLRVQTIWDATKHQGVFEPGDRLLSVAGVPVELCGDLARSIEGVAVDVSVPLVVERLGTVKDLAWIPFPRRLYEPATPPYEAGSLLDIVEQLGVTFEGYPLDFVPECQLRRTSEDRPLEAILPRGSYLFVLRKIGYSDARLPVLVPSSLEREVLSVRLLESGEAPEDFVYVPAGPVSHGGDPVAFQSLESGEAEIEGFLIGRREVTLGEYLEFLNDPEVVTDELGFCEPKTATVRRILEGMAERRVHLVPSQPWQDRSPVKKDILFLTKEGGRWAIPPDSGLRETSPALGIPQIAAVEYAHWLSEKEGGRRRYRLPTDLEWEKAARGADRRVYVWGSYLVRSFCHSARGSYHRPRAPQHTQRFPMDESVYGVRDVAGSVAEHTSSAVFGGFLSRRGGSWYDIDDTHFRLANRNSRPPYGRGTDTGFRLVLELGPPGSGR